MKVFQQVMIDSKRAVEADRLGIPRPDGIGGRQPTDLQKEAGAAAAGNWDAEADEQRAELERERDVQQKVQSRGQDLTSDRGEFGGESVCQPNIDEYLTAFPSSIIQTTLRSFPGDDQLGSPSLGV